MYPFTLGAQLLCWFKCCFPWFYHDYWIELEPEYWNMFQYVVATPIEYEELDDKEPRRNLKQILWSSVKSKIIRDKPRDPNFTPDLVQWIHKEELIRILSTPKSRDGNWRTQKPYCWEEAWKCLVLFAMKNKYGRYYYTIVDVCTLQHQDGAESDLKEWQNHFLQVIRSRRPLRIYATTTGPFNVLHRDYYMTLSISGFLEIYLEPEKELQEALLNKVWPMRLGPVKYLLENAVRDEYYSRQTGEIYFHTRKLIVSGGEINLPTKLKFLEPIELNPGKWILRELNIYLKWKKKKQKERWEDRSISSNSSKIETPLKKNKNSTNMNSNGSNSTKKVRKTYSEFLWKREKYLNEEENTGLFFPSVLNFRFQEEGDSLLLNRSKDEVDIFLKYRKFWSKWSPLLIFGDDGTLYSNPTKELIKKKYEKIAEAQYEAKMELIKKLPKTRWGVLYSEVGLPLYLQHLFSEAKMKSEYAYRIKTGKDFLNSSIYRARRKAEIQKYWRERQEFNKQWRRKEWVQRSIDRRKYSTGLEWFKFKYPSIFANVNEKWKEIMYEN